MPVKSKASMQSQSQLPKVSSWLGLVCFPKIKVSARHQKALYNLHEIYTIIH